MEITDIRFRKILAAGKMRAIVSVTFDDFLVVHDIKIISGQNGLFVAMPSRPAPGGEFKDIVHPINREARAKLQDAVISSYLQIIENEFCASGQADCSNINKVDAADADVDF